MLHGPRRTLRSTASGVRLDFERVVPWRPHDPKVDCRWAARDIRSRHYASKTERPTNLNPEVASWRLSGLALFGHGRFGQTMSAVGGRAEVGFRGSQDCF